VVKNGVVGVECVECVNVVDELVILGIMELNDELVNEGYRVVRELVIENRFEVI